MAQAADQIRGRRPSAHQGAMNESTKVVIAGHSNTVPELLRAFGVTDRVEIPDDRYGDLFVVELEGEAVRALALAPDGERLAVGTSAGTLWFL